MRSIAIASAAGLLASLAVVAGLTGCKISVNKGANGEQKNVRIDTPFGGVHVDTDQTSAADLGLPVYPGSQIVKDDNNHQSADVHMGFGDWELRVRAVSYETNDKKNQVVAFYKNALSRYGDVLTCQDNAAVGTPTRTSEGLTCEQENMHSSGYKNGNGGFQLKAGSVRHQHIVGFEAPVNGQTRFALVELSLPNVGADSANKSN